MQEGAKFCSLCSQKKFDGRIRLKDLLSNMMINLIHLDGKFIRMAWMLFIPGKVSTDYFEGKIIRYPNPVQFFFITAFFFVLLCSKHCNSSLEKKIEFTKEVTADSTIKFSGANIIDAGKLFIEYKKIRSIYGTLPDSLKSLNAERVLDTVLQRRQNLVVNFFNTDSVKIGLGTRNLQLMVEDVVYTDPEILPEKYDVHNWIERKMLVQGIKSLRDIRHVQNAIIGNVTFNLLGIIAIMSVILWLLLRRRRGYYVEHFVFLMHYLSAVLMVFGLGLGFTYWFSFKEDLLAVLFVLGAWAFLFFSMRRFYGLTNARTILHFSIVSLVGLFVGVALMVLGVFISVLLI